MQDITMKITSTIIFSMLWSATRETISILDLLFLAFLKLTVK